MTDRNNNYFSVNEKNNLATMSLTRTLNDELLDQDDNQLGSPRIQLELINDDIPEAVCNEFEPHINCDWSDSLYDEGARVPNVLVQLPCKIVLN